MFQNPFTCCKKKQLFKKLMNQITSTKILTWQGANNPPTPPVLA
jgi:hypothetical protein